MALRSSELVMRIERHFFWGRDVSFFISLPNTHVLAQMRPMDVYQFLWSQVFLWFTTSIHVKISNIHGRGVKKRFYEREVSPTCAFCIIGDSYHWACLARPGH